MLEKINMSDVVVNVKDLTRNFGDFVAVDHVSFQITRGDVVGYLGPNGSGKTTTIRMLLGLLKPTEGSATVLGYDSFSQTDQVRARVGYMSQKFAIYDDLTVLENLTFYAGTYGISDSKMIVAAISRTGLSGHESTLTRELSAGWRQRLALGIALVHQPKVLFLDEPTSGVDPTARRNFWDLIYELAEEGVTVLVTTHYLDEAEYCNSVGMMRNGKLLAMDTPRSLKERYIKGNVCELYLTSLTDGLSALSTMPEVKLASLAGDHIRLITNGGMNEREMKKNLDKAGVTVTSILQGEPTLEDVFSTLAR